MKIRVLLNEQSINAAIRDLETYKRRLQERADKLVKALAEIGVNVSRIGFANAQYDGTNDVQVSVEEKGNGYAAVVATGEAVLFIEFGTGVYYPDNYPDKPAGVLAHGEYGKGHGKHQTWAYYGNPGTNGYVVDKPNGTQIVLTHGNPPSMSMYNAKERMRQDIQRVAREVFASG